MKLIDGIVTNTIDGKSFAIATGKASKTFNGLVENNETAAFIFELLKTDQTFDSIVDAMCKNYDAPRDVIEKDVTDLLNMLKSKNIIED